MALNSSFLPNAGFSYQKQCRPTSQVWSSQSEGRSSPQFSSSCHIGNKVTVRIHRVAYTVSHALTLHIVMTQAKFTFKLGSRSLIYKRDLQPCSYGYDIFSTANLPKIVCDMECFGFSHRPVWWLCTDLCQFDFLTGRDLFWCSYCVCVSFCVPLLERNISKVLHQSTLFWWEPSLLVKTEKIQFKNKKSPQEWVHGPNIWPYDKSQGENI